MGLLPIDVDSPRPPVGGALSHNVCGRHASRVGRRAMCAVANKVIRSDFASDENATKVIRFGVCGYHGLCAFDDVPFVEGISHFR